MTKKEFLHECANFSSHRYLLWDALEQTKHMKLPVMELGSGMGSTPFLRQYCEDNGLSFYSYDFDREWAAKTGSNHVMNWDIDVDWRKEYGVVLVDESPGEHRKISIGKLLHAKILVVHDSEPIGWNSSDYQVRPLFDKFKYTMDLQSPYVGGAWASALSNFIDVTKWGLA